MPLQTAGQATPTTDVVAVYDAAGVQLFADARPLKASVKETAKVFEHPLETGATITDYRVINPVEIELSMMLASEDYRNVYDQIRQVFLRGDLLTVATRSGSYRNMLISEIPHEEDPEQYDALPLGMSLKEAQFVDPQYAKLTPRQVKAPANASTVEKGEQRPVEEPPEVAQSTLFKLFN